jgi:peptidoglycan/LPS O-acetylase OafA/YrhL
MRYRAEIDGLRALAVLPVILYHAGFIWFSGGFVGVDVFFVISGYLITTVLLEDMEKDKFSIVDFYNRRARRLLPALFFIVLLTLFFSLMYLSPHALKDLGQSIFAVSLFLSNVFFFIEVDYFANTAKLAPLLHTWSLGVEEQFYILFPFLLLALKNKSTGFRGLIILSLLVTSLLLSEFMVHENSQFSFFMPFTRFWELAAGSMIALNRRQLDVLESSSIHNLLAALGIILIFIPILFYTKSTLFPGFTALVPVVGTVLVIAFANQHTFVARMLSCQILVSIGLLSYSLYLSHNVVFALSRNIGIPLSSISIQIVLIFISVFIAMVSYFCVEKPLRHIKASKRAYLFSSLVLITIFASGGYLLHKTDGLKQWKLEALSPEMSALVIDSTAEIYERRQIKYNVMPSAKTPFNKELESHKVLILGDSKSEDLYVAIATNYAGIKYQFRRLYHDDTVMNSEFPKWRNLSAEEYSVANELLAEADEIVLSATWQYQSIDGVIGFVKFLRELDKKVSIVSTANFNDVASVSYNIAKKNMRSPEVESYFYENIRADWQRQYFQLKKSLEKQATDVRFLEKLHTFCDIDLEQCSLRDSGGWHIYDSGHLTVNGYNFFGDYVLENWFPE